MGGQRDTRRLIRALASGQHGVVAHHQLVSCGWTPRQIERRLHTGELEALHRGVYLIAPVAPPFAREMAAVLACGPGATLSHRSAAHLYEILPPPTRPGPVDVTVTRHNPGARDGVRLHRPAALGRHEVRIRIGIPVTAPVRTVADLAGDVTPATLELVVAEAFALRLVDRSQLLRAVDAGRGRRGVARLRALLDADRPAARTRSAPERALLRLIRGADLPEPETNVRIAGWEVDFLWRAARLVVEVDGYSAHSSPWAFERDRRKSAELEDLGYTVRRASARQIRDQPELALARIRRSLAPAPVD